MNSDTIPVWKKIYHLVCGGNNPALCNDVEDILNVCKQDLIEVFVKLAPYTSKSYEEWKKIPGLKDFVADDEMCSFIKLLSKELNLDTNVAWTVICNFLMFEYYGKVDELKSIIRYDTDLKCLIEHIWYFYSGDRMFLLKILRYIFEKVHDKNHQFYEQFNTFIKSVEMKELWKNLLKSFEILINEIDRDTAEMVSNDNLTQWIHRNNREQIEIVTLMIHTIQYFKVDGMELENVLKIFIRHGFAKQPLYQDSIDITRYDDLKEIKYCEISCVLVIMEKYWKSPGVCRMLPRNVEKNLELLQMQNDVSIVLFAWAVLKTSIDASDAVVEYCNVVTYNLIEKKMFRTLHHLIIDKMFAKCKTGDIVVEAIFKLMIEFTKMCTDFTYLHEEIGFCYLTGELLGRKGLVVLDYLGPIFQLSMDAFPFVFTPFLSMCKSLISLPDHYDDVMKLIQNIPSFLAEIPWNDYSNKFPLAESRRLFTDSELFIIPEGTIVERFRYQGMDFTRFIYPFSFFLLMEQFIKSLSVITFEMGTSWYCYNNLIQLVHMGYKFIIHILKHYKGDFRSDHILKTLLHRLDVVPAQFCDGPTKNFNFIRLYFEANVTAITLNLMDFAEAFPPIIRKKFLPQVASSGEQFMFNEIHDSILFKSLKEEESLRDHSLLVQYLILVQYVVEKNICQEEVQAAGIWYILNVAFPLHQQWSYDDELQMTIICKYCMSILVKILQIPLTESNGESEKLFELCHNAFMFDEIMISSYLSVFCRDKFFLQNLMEQEHNWINGPKLEYIENTRLQIVFLLLLYRHRENLPRTTKCVIDDKISTIARSISGYMVNPYSTALRLLSCRFLEILARDENVPMMALLGLDYDQIQRLFLDKLRDPIEDDTIKMNILELISTCISSQHGMTAAFFNIKRSRKWYSDDKEKSIERDSVADFMIDYLQNIKKSHAYLKCPLQVAILRVMVNLWTGGKQHLIHDVVQLDAFWPLLAGPLFHEYTQSPRVYAYILKIFSKQLSYAQTEENKFISTIEKFLTNEKQLLLWRDYILDMLEEHPRTLDEVEEMELLINTWLEFILMAESEANLKKFKDDKIKYLFVEMCLEGMHFTLANMHCLDAWMNLCLIKITSWGLQFKDKDEILAKKIISMFSIIKLHYSQLNYNSRAAVLTIIQRVLTDLKKYFEGNTSELLQFLNDIGILIDYEYTVLEEEVWKQIIERKLFAKDLMLPWMMCINISNKLLKFNNVNDYSMWFSYRNYLNNMIKCTGDLLNHPDTLPLAKLAFRSLILYIESPLAFDFINVNMIKFYDIIEPPITALLLGKGVTIQLMQLEEGWVLCTLLMKFNQAFLKKFQYRGLPSCYMFIKLHEQILQHIMLLPESTVALKALDLLINTLIFFDMMLVNWQLEWYRKSNNTYNYILTGVKKIINSCVYTILRPKNIIAYVLDSYHRLNQLDKVPVTLMVGIMNRLITATGICFSILYRTNPSLVDLMDVYIPDTMTVLIQNDFSVPKFELPIPYDLTYGKLLCLAHFMCKTLDALSIKHRLKPSAREALREAEKEKKKEKTPEQFYTRCAAFVEHQDPSDNLPNQKLSSFLRYAMYEYSGLADPWIRKLDPHHVQNSLELLMMFLAQQVFLATKTIDAENLPYFKRNIASELQFFYEHIKKHTSSLLNQQVTTTLRPVSSYKSEMDIVKRYLLYCKENKKSEEVLDKNFCLIIYFWFINICQLR